jgi:hypothetical protein
VSRSDSVLAGALEDHNDEDEGCDMCGPSFTCDVKLVLDEVPGLLAALDELTAEGTDERRVHLAGGFTEARTA